MENRTVREDGSTELSHGESASQPMPQPFAASRSAVPDDPLGPVRSVARRWRLLFVMILLGGTFGWVSAVVAADAAIAPVEVDHYEADHVLVLDNTVPAGQAVLSVQNLNLLAKRVTIGEVPEAVAESLDLSPEVASNQVRAVIRSDSETLDIITVAETPRQAELLADEFASQFLSYLEADAASFADESIAEAETRLAEAEANLAEVRERLDAAEAAEDQEAVTLLNQDEQQFINARVQANAVLLEARSSGVPVVPIETLQFAEGNSRVISQLRFDELVDRAEVGENIAVLFGSETEEVPESGALSAVSSSLPDGVPARVGFGALLGFLTGLLVAIVINRLDNRIRSKRQIELLLDLPVIAEVPSVGRPKRKQSALVSKAEPRSRFAEQYRSLASVLSYAKRSRGQRGQVVLVTSPGPAEGKTTTVANLAAMLAESGRTVMMVNCDFRRPRLHELIDSSYEAEKVAETAVPGVYLVSNVVADRDAAPTEVIGAQRKVIEKARGRYDVVLIDTAPLLATNDAVDLLDLADDVVLVVRAGKTKTHAADRAAEMLERRQAHVLGVAITDVSSRHSADYYYYDGYYNDEAIDVRSDSDSSTGQTIDLEDFTRDDDEFAEVSHGPITGSASTSSSEE